MIRSIKLKREVLVMNRNVLLALPIVCLSTSVLANDRGGFYISGGIYGHNIEVNEQDNRLPDLTLGLRTGYDFQILKPFVIGAEFEYTIPSEYSLIDKSRNSMVWEYSALSLSVKPKYYFSSSSGLYFAGILGYTKHKRDQIFASYENKRADGSESDISYGVEVGYEFNSGLLLNVMYRQSDVDFGAVPFDISTMGFNVGYKS